MTRDDLCACGCRRAFTPKCYGVFEGGRLYRRACLERIALARITRHLRETRAGREDCREVPDGQEERIAKYRELAAAELPLFS